MSDDGRGAERVAVASRDGKRINVHLGHVRAFYVFDVDRQGVRFVERRDVGGSDPDAQRTPMPDIFEALRDCQAVFVSKIGENRRDALQSKGVETVVDYAHQDIQPALSAYAHAERCLREGAAS